MQQMVSLLQILLLAQRLSGTIMSIIRSSRVLYRWLLPVVFGALVFKSPVWCRAVGCVSGFSGSLRDSANRTHSLKSIIQVVVARGIWCFGFQVAGLV